VNTVGGESETTEIAVNETDFEGGRYGVEHFEAIEEREGQYAPEVTSVPGREFLYDNREETVHEEEDVCEETLLPVKGKTVEVSEGEEDYFCDYYADYKEIATVFPRSRSLDV
ncbi:hypothetical protein V7S43_013253, partial [Phytophthora oleae]